MILLIGGLMTTVACGDDDDDDNDDNNDDADDDDDTADDDTGADDDDTGDDDDDDTGDDDTADDDTGDDDTGDDDTSDDDTGDDDTPVINREVWSYVPPEGPYHVETVGWIDDIDGDGAPEVLAHAYDSITTPDEGDTTFCISGAPDKGTLIWGVHPTNNNTGQISDSGGYGDRVIINSRDLNEDGYEDVLLGTAWGNRTAFALDGTDGSTLWQFCTYTNPLSPDSGWIQQIIPFPDVTGDDIPEVAFGVGSDNNSGWLINGKTGDVVWQLNASADVLYGVTVIDDINNDGSPEAVFAGGDDEDRVFCVDGDSSVSGTVLWTATTGNNYAIAAIDDVNSDGYQDVLAGSWGTDAVVCLNGHTGAELWTSNASVNPMRIVTLDDVNDDGIDDLAVSSMSGYAFYVIDGADGTTIWSAGASDYVWAIDAVDDINQDGVDDVVAGGFDGYVRMYDGVDGTLLWEYKTGDAKIKTIRAVPDMTGDGRAEVVAGTQCLDQGTSGAGTVFLLEGKP